MPGRQTAEEVRLLAPRYGRVGAAATPLTEDQRAAWRRYFEALESGALTRLDHGACPQCGAEERRIIAETDRYGDAVRTALCKGCGLIYSTNPFDAASTVGFYRDHYRALYTKSEDRRAAVTSMFAKTLASADKAKRLADHLGLVPGRDRIVEIGAGAGWNLAPYAAAGFQTIGLDYDAELAELGGARGIEMIDLGDRTPADVIREPVSMIILQEVLEHTIDPFETLCEINDLLTPNGVLYLTVPSFEELPFGAANGRLLGLLQNAHNFLFDQWTLTAYLRQAGFEPLIVRSELRVVARKIGAPKRAPTPIPGNFTRAARRLWWSERVLQYYWRGLALAARLVGGGKSMYYRIKGAHRQLLSPRRRREIAEQRTIGC